MRDLWVDHGNGVLLIQTDTLFIRIRSRAHKNYHTVHSSWQFTFAIKGRYGYVCRSYHEFGGTFNEALERAETILQELYAALSEIM